MSGVVCNKCGIERTAADHEARTPCPNCGATSFDITVSMELGKFTMAGLDVDITVQRALHEAEWRIICNELDIDILRGVCEGSNSYAPDVGEKFKLDVIGIAKHAYEERIKENEWRKLHVLVPMVTSIIALIIAVIALFT